VRVVLDTNILLSACWTPDGLEAKLVSMALNGALTPCLSTATAAEYRDVLLRPKFANLRDRAQKMLGDFERAALHVDPTATVKAASDEDDNRFLECAVAAQAEYLITGNLRHYPAGCGVTKILNARAFFDATSAP
jgi:putative PIN family toxin of toxin-antitoxin system